MHLAEGRKPFAVVPAKEGVYALVGVETEELADHFDGENLGVRELGCGSAASDALSFESVVNEAEDGNYEAVMSPERRPPSLRSVWMLPRVRRSRC
jgi:hypothetical protein